MRPRQHEALATEAKHDALATEAKHETLAAASYAPADEDANETELSLDNLDSDSPATPVRDVEEIYDLPPLDEVMAKSTLLARSASQPAPVYREPEPIRFVEPEPVVAPAIEDAYQREPADTADHFPVQEVIEELTTTEPFVPVDDALLLDAPAPVIEDEPAESMTDSAHVAALTPSAPEPVAVEPPEPAAPEAATAADAEAEAGPDKDSASSRRRKRQQQKSARARKDKLRSTTADQKTPPPPVPEPARPASPTGWLVSPQRAAQFEAPVPVPMPAPRPIAAPPPAPIRPAPVAVPAVPSFVPTPVGPLPQPVYPSSVSSSSGYGTSSAHQPTPPGPLAPAPIQFAPPPTSQVKVKPAPPPSFTPRRPTHAGVSADPRSCRSLRHPRPRPR